MPELRRAVEIMAARRLKVTVQYHNGEVLDMYLSEDTAVNSILSSLEVGGFVIFKDATVVNTLLPLDKGDDFYIDNEVTPSAQKALA